MLAILHLLAMFVADRFKPRRQLDDCLDHVLILGERHLLRVLTSYSVYYNETRTHLGLSKDATHRSGELSSDPGPSSPCRFCADYIIVTRGYNFREGQPIVGDIRRLPHAAGP